MKAPDKIYLNQPGEVTFNALWFDKPKDKGFNHEYIRKDALLEWADNYKKHIDEEQLLDDTAKSVTKSVLDDLIDKLESL